MLLAATMASSSLLSICTTAASSATSVTAENSSSSSSSSSVAAASSSFSPDNADGVATGGAGAGERLLAAAESAAAPPTTTVGSSSSSSKYTTPQRSAGLAAVTPGTLNGTTTTTTAATSSSPPSSSEEEEPETSSSGVAVVAIVSESNGESSGAEHVADVGEAMAMELELEEEKRGDNSHHHHHQAATTTATSTTTTSIQEDEDDKVEGATNSKVVAANVNVVVIKPSSSSSSSIQLGPRVTTSASTLPPPPNNTMVKIMESNHSSSTTTLSSSHQHHHSDSPVKPRNLDGALNTNTTQQQQEQEQEQQQQQQPSAAVTAIKEECPSTPTPIPSSCGAAAADGRNQPQSQLLKNTTHFPSSPPSFLAAKISPLRSSSARKKEQEEEKQQQQQQKTMMQQQQQQHQNKSSKNKTKVASSSSSSGGITSGGEDAGTVVATTTTTTTTTTMPSNRVKTPPPSNANSMDDDDDPANHLSPGMFLCTPKPSSGNHRGSGSGGGGGGGSSSLSSRPSSIVPGLTPTNFASDFGKGHRKEDSLNAMDASNVFAWLHSPTGQGLFSPNGGLNSLSATNTPRGMYGFSGPTPPTAAATTTGKAGITPKLAPSSYIQPLSSSSGTTSSSGNNHHHHGYFVELDAAGFDAGVNTPKIPECQRSMICISPMSSKKKGKNSKQGGAIILGCVGDDMEVGGGGEGAPDTPMSINFSEVFASPRLPTPRLSRMGPSAGGVGGVGGSRGPVAPVPRMEDGGGVVSSSDGRQSSPVASALHVAERGINLDDDLNALLQLAETTTPGVGRPSTMAFMSPLLTNSLQRVTAAPPSSLQMPIITGSSMTSFGKGGGVNISPPQLAIRSSSSSTSCGMSEGSGGSPIKASSLKKNVKKRKLPDGPTGTMPGGYHGQQQPPTPVGYSHPSMTPYHHQQHHHAAPPHPSAAEVNAANHRYYHRPAYISQGYVYSSTGHPTPQQHYAYPDNHQSKKSVSSKSPSPVKSLQKSAPLVQQSKQRSKPKVIPVARKELKKVASASLPIPPPPSVATNTGKRVRKASPKSSGGSGSASVVKKGKTVYSDPGDKERIAAAIVAVNKIYGDGREKERKLKEVTLRGVTQRPSRKWQAQLYYAGKSRYIGVFDSKEKASLAYEIAREVLKTDKDDQGPSNAEETERDVNLARKAAFTGVNELSDK